MMTVRQYLLVLVGCAICASTTGCEDIVQVDLNVSEPRLVIQGFIRNASEVYTFYVSRTTDFYNPGYPIPVSNATIVVTHKTQVDSLWEVTSGRYEPFTEPGWINAAPGDTVFASVTVDGVEYQAMSIVPPPILIDSLSLVYQEGGGLGLDEDEGYRLHIYFTDLPQQDDYARFRVFQNGLSVGDYYLYDGRFSDGNDIDYDYFADTFQPGDYGRVELWSVGEVMYDYFRTLSEVVVSDDATDFFDITPANPNSNWNNGALGFFGVYDAQGTSFIFVERSAP